ncbi:MAG: hypothetical protein LBT84_04175 [Spirochaetia bacterium]|jgi:hypothetical protein|nr:hypothetical protein [Spirochaetia bacterium]
MENGQTQETPFELDVAIKATGGDVQKAMDMVSGEYFDNAVLKGTFLLQDSGYSGMFLIFFNIANNYIPFMDSSIVKSTLIYEQFDAAAEWAVVLREIGTLKQSDDIVDIPGANDKIINEILQENFFPDAKSGNLERIEGSLELIIRKVLGNQPVSCNLSIEQTTSLAMFKESVPFEDSGTVPPVRNVTPQQSEFDQLMADIEKDAEFVIEGSAVIAPVKGKSINEVKPGEKIMVLLTNKDPVSRRVLSYLKATDDDIIYPVPGKVVEKVSLAERGIVVIYALVAKGIMAKLIEEDSLKITMVDGKSGADSPGGVNKVSIGIVLFIAALAAIIILILV